MSGEINQSSVNKGNPYIIPVAIVIAGLLVAGAIIYIGQAQPSSVIVGNNNGTPTPSTGAIDNIKAVSADDHIRGSLEAPVKVVEFSDLECPFCKRFHDTMKQVSQEYGDQMAWVYRHFPLDQLHSKARKEAVASECAAELGGNNAFWAYVDKFFEITPSNNQTNIDVVLPQIAREIGLNESQFNSCLSSDKYDDKIEANYQDSVASGGTGTPYTVVIAVNGKKFPISGALPYESVKAVIEQALKETN